MHLPYSGAPVFKRSVHFFLLHCHQVTIFTAKKLIKPSRIYTQAAKNQCCSNTKKKQPRITRWFRSLPTKCAGCVFFFPISACFPKIYPRFYSTFSREQQGTKKQAAAAAGSRGCCCFPVQPPKSARKYALAAAAAGTPQKL